MEEEYQNECYSQEEFNNTSVDYIQASNHDLENINSNPFGESDEEQENIQEELPLPDETNENENINIEEVNDINEEDSIDPPIDKMEDSNEYASIELEVEDEDNEQDIEENQNENDLNNEIKLEDAPQPELELDPESEAAQEPIQEQELEHLVSERSQEPVSESDCLNESGPQSPVDSQEEMHQLSIEDIQEQVIEEYFPDSTIVQEKEDQEILIPSEELISSKLEEEEIVPIAIEYQPEPILPQQTTDKLVQAKSNRSKKPKPRPLTSLTEQHTLTLSEPQVIQAEEIGVQSESPLSVSEGIQTEIIQEKVIEEYFPSPQQSPLQSPQQSSDHKESPLKTQRPLPQIPTKPLPLPVTTISTTSNTSSTSPKPKPKPLPKPKPRPLSMIAQPVTETSPPIHATNIRPVSTQIHSNDDWIHHRPHTTDNITDQLPVPPPANALRRPSSLLNEMQHGQAKPMTTDTVKPQPLPRQRSLETTGRSSLLARPAPPLTQQTSMSSDLNKLLIYGIKRSVAEEYLQQNNNQFLPALDAVHKRIEHELTLNRDYYSGLIWKPRLVVTISKLT